MFGGSCWATGSWGGGGGLNAWGLGEGEVDEEEAATTVISSGLRLDQERKKRTRKVLLTIVLTSSLGAFLYRNNPRRADLPGKKGKNRHESSYDISKK